MSVPPERLLKIVCSSFRKPEMLSPIRTGKSAWGTRLNEPIRLAQ